MALLDEVRTYLIGQGVGVTGSTASWAVTMGQSVHTPAQLLTVFETGGLGDELHESNPITRPTFQVRARGSTASTGYAGARAKLAAAETAFLSVGPATTGLGGRRYVCILPQSQPVSLGWDANHRPVIVQNYVALRSRTT